MSTELIASLTDSGALTKDWAPTFLAVPRREFLPDVLWECRDEDGNYHPVDRAQQPDRWLALANGEEPIVVQVDDGHPAAPGDRGEVPTSSSSMPYMVALMLKYLEIRGGERVLEIGTGTGWNAALMAHRLGTDRITTVEIDPEVAEQARKALTAAGLGEVRVITGNGSEGYPGEAPYSRVISTAACHTVPYAWVEQCRAGGRIVTPWGSEFKNWALIALDVHADGTATGGVVGTADFMRLRDQRLESWMYPEHWQVEIATSRTTSIAPADVMRRGDVLMAMAAWVPDCRARYSPPSANPDGRSTMRLSDHRTGSWAILSADPAATEYTVVQGGGRWLFDEVEAAYQRWTEKGCPGTDEWLITVDRHGQRMELM
jgi:protein-L-isoaspartate(D-aspartate) O-methyltransferase